MAPKKGGGGGYISGYGSSDSGGSSCGYCNEPLELFGYGWKDSNTDAQFAIEIIITVLLFVCIGLAFCFKWVRERGTDKLRNAGYIIAAGFMIIYYLFSLVDTGLRESDTETTYWYYLTYIFSGIFWRISELLILAIILRTIAETGGLRSMNIVIIVVITVLALITTADYGLLVAQNAKIMSDGPSYEGYNTNLDSLQENMWHVMLAYQALYFVVSILAACAGFLSMIKERSKQTLIMAAFVLPALFLRSLMGVIYYGAYDSAFYGTSKLTDHTLINISWANVFIYDLMTGAIFLGVAIIGVLRPTNAGVLQHKTYGNVPQNQMAYENQPEVYAPTGYGNPEMASANQPHIIR